MRPGTRWNVSLQRVCSPSFSCFSGTSPPWCSSIFQHLSLYLGPWLLPLRFQSFPLGFRWAPLLGALCSPPIPPTLAPSPLLFPLPTAALFPLILTCVILSLQTQTELHNLKKAVTSGPVLKNSLCYLEVLCPVCSAGIYTPWSQILVRSTILDPESLRSHLATSALSETRVGNRSFLHFVGWIRQAVVRD